MYDPNHPYAGYPPPYGWPEPPRRRRLSRKGVTVLLLLFALLCALLLAVLKLGLAVWHAPITAKVGDAAMRVGTVAADVAMEEYEVPGEVRQAVRNEAEALREDVFPEGQRLSPVDTTEAAKQ